MPSTASQARSSSPNSVRMSGQQVAAPRVDVLAEQRDLSHALAREPGHLRDDLARSAALLSSADGRNDAVRALGVAAHRDLHPRLERPLAVHRQLAGEAALVEAEPSARDAEAAGAEPLPEVRDRTRPEGDVDVRVELEEPLALCLGIAAADGDHLARIVRLERGCLCEVRGELRVRLLADRAGVEDEDVGLCLRRRLPQSELLQHALDPLAVVSVHLAAERGDVVAPHGPECVPVVFPDSGTRLELFCLTAVALLVIPGPAVLYVVVAGRGAGTARGLASVLGIHLGTLVHVAAATVGLSALIVASSLAFNAVKFAGAVYLIFDRRAEAARP